MTVHSGTAVVEQDRAAGPDAYCPVDGPAHSWWQWDQDDLGALAAPAQHPVTVFFTQVGDVRPGGFEDPQAEQAQHGHQREVTWVHGLAGGGEQGLELQMGETERR